MLKIAVLLTVFATAALCNPTPKPGSCPDSKISPLQDVTICDVKCSNDNCCEGEQKCCSVGCRRLCVDPKKDHDDSGVKPGKCPKPPKDLITTCIARCENDHSCGGKQKCCSWGCEKKCMDPKGGDDDSDDSSSDDDSNSGSHSNEKD